MTNDHSLELETATLEGQAELRQDSSSSAIEGTTASRPGQISRQYNPNETLHFDYNYEPTHQSNFRRRFGILQFSHGPSLPRSQAAVDLLTTITCFTLMHLIYLGSLNLTSDRTIVLFSSVLFLLLSLSAGGIYSTKRMRNLSGELTTLVLCWMCAFAAVGLFAFLTKTAGSVSRFWITASMLFSLLSLASIRAMGCLELIAGSKVKPRNVVICGNESSITPVMRSLYKLSNPKLRVVRVFEFSPNQNDMTLPAELLQSSANQIIKFVENQRRSGEAIEQVWIAVSANQSRLVSVFAESLINSSVDVCVVPDLYSERLLNGDSTRYGETKIINISEISLSPAADRFKRAFDIFVASVAMLVFCIPMIIIAVLVKLETPGPALFRQKRYGVDGREIEVLKFRSMWVHSDHQARQATKNDSRVTRTGKILRATSLDELPQLLNVMRGTMSLVGPRPHAVAHNEMWRNQINGYMLRHKVRPGITGWAQVNGWRGETDKPYKMHQRVKFDLEYIRNWSPWLDVKILLFTVIKGFRSENAY